MFGLNHLPLGFSLALRELKSRYQESTLGFLWVLLSPLMMIGIYSLFFGRVLGMNESVKTPGGFTLYLFAGYLAWDLFGRMAGEGADIFLGNRSILTKVRLPLDAVMQARILYHLFHWLFATIVLFIVMLFLGISPGWSSLLLPVVVFDLALFTIGVSSFFAVLSLFLKDFKEVLGILLVAWLFATPIFYDARNLGILGSGRIEGVLYQLNPMFHFVELMRDCTVYGVWPTPLSLGGATLGSILVYVAGRLFLQRSRPLILDLL